jgi:MinD-like ATPase involved in chromosome partitioning or flagellar assembly
MHSVTFYSFKGGVGRTLALANVGYELANAGKKVLLVDFDLEAPGLHTFKVFSTKEPHLGLVDFITDYLYTNKAPDVREYIFEALGIGKKNGRLWVMPAGKNDNEFQMKLNQVDWAELYKEKNGFLLFEDLKAQWKNSYNFDYVLIDSRTGHTDIGGICTRQLPNAVVILFFPNEQNLSGLKPVVFAIRKEDEKEKKETKLYFIMSNVPDLDDEENILANFESRFKEELQFPSLSTIIHRYESLSLLEQSLFVAERPKSRLAREYRKLTEIITEENIEDREGVLRRLDKKRISKLFADDKLLKEEESFIDRIVETYPKDGELLYRLSKYLKDLGLSKKSEILLQRSIGYEYRSPELFLAQSEIHHKENDNEEALSAIREVFSFKLNPEQIGRAADILRRINPNELLKFVNTTAFNSLSANECIWLTEELGWCKPGLQVIEQLFLRHLKNDALPKGTHDKIKDQLMLCLIGLSKFSEAINLFGSSRLNANELDDVAQIFNYGMAEWGLNRSLPKDMFERVVQLDISKNWANYCQCLSIAYWAIGDNKNANQYLSKAINLISEDPDAEFSCWRYLNVTPDEFKDDCHSIEKLISGEEIVPLFFNPSQ